MILAIAIISGIVFVIYFLMCSLSYEDPGSTHLLTYGAILVLSTWCLNPIIGKIFLWITVVSTLFALVVYIQKQLKHLNK